MSLDVYLEQDDPLFPSSTGPRIFVREDGQMRQISRDEWDRRYPGREPVTVESDPEDKTVYRGNVTHNLVEMAQAAQVYEPLWRPETINIERAEQLIGPLTEGLARLREQPDRFKAFNPANGWGTYEGLVQFVDDYLTACKAYPSATVRVSR